MGLTLYKEALLAWAVSGAYRWFASKRGLVAPVEIVEATKAARNKLDYVRQWLDECTQDDKESRVTNAVLYASYKTWCDDNGVTANKERAFGRDMSKKGYEGSRWYQGKRRVRGYIGLAIAE